MTSTPNKMSNKVGFSYRTDAESWRIFTALATLKGETPTDIFRARERSYIEENGALLREAAKDLEKLSNLTPHEPNAETIAAMEEARNDLGEELTGIAATRAAIAEIRAGGGKTFDTIDDLMADLHNDDED